ncbi:MAG: hypothetical protein M0P02_04780 [Sulfurospirillaceae bacterium]|nr:hypothetical protein [Sulfurospirillaceae bacterium]MCK9546748.1 hypothetical protein [Sulfurospirillaceae bacterium]
MIREIIKPTSNTYTISIPKKYINQQVEILIFPVPVDEKKSSKEKVFLETSGILKDKKIDPIKWQKDIRIDREI